MGVLALGGEGTSPVLTERELPLVAEGVRLLYDGYTARAAAVFARLKAVDPASPASEIGAVLADALRLREAPEDGALQEAIEGHLRLAEAKADRLLSRDPKDPRGLFYRGAAHFFRSQVKRQRGATLGTLTELRKAHGFLQEVLNLKPDSWDAYVGLGAYNYFVDVLPPLTKVARWVLFLPRGDREVGIRQLQIASEKSLLLGPLARSILVTVYARDEKRPEVAEALAVRLREDFPNNPWFHLNQGYQYLGHRRGQERAVKTFQEVLGQVEAQHPNYTREIRDLARLGLLLAERGLGREKEVRRLSLALLRDPPPRPKYALPIARLILGEHLARKGKALWAEDLLREVLSTQDMGHFDWRVGQAGYPSARDVRDQAQAALDSLEVSREARGAVASPLP